MNTFTRASIAAISACVMFIATNTQAHHSFAMFDEKLNTTIEGTVKEFQWTNPHIWIQLMVMDASGKEVEWSIEGGSVTSLGRQGWKRTTIKPGDKAKIIIHPLKDGSNGGSLVSAYVNDQPTPDFKY